MYVEIADIAFIFTLLTSSTVYTMIRRYLPTSFVTGLQVYLYLYIIYVAFSQIYLSFFLSHLLCDRKSTCTIYDVTHMIYDIKAIYIYFSLSHLFSDGRACLLVQCMMSLWYVWSYDVWFFFSFTSFVTGVQVYLYNIQCHSYDIIHNINFPPPLWQACKFSLSWTGKPPSCHRSTWSARNKGCQRTFIHMLQ